MINETRRPAASACPFVAALRVCRAEPAPTAFSNKRPVSATSPSKIPGFREITKDFRPKGRHCT